MSVKLRLQKYEKSFVSLQASWPYSSAEKDFYLQTHCDFTGHGAFKFHENLDKMKNLDNFA